MSSRCRTDLVILAALALVAGCDREERNSRGQPLPETAAGGMRLSALQPGMVIPAREDPRADEY